MSNEYKKHITGTLISKLADGLVFGLSIVLTTGCEKLSEKYGVKEEQTYGPEMLNERNISHQKAGMASMRQITVEIPLFIWQLKREI
ncbi:MAG: hypothetical protein NMK33_01090 [Candidatus Cardinium sp.]|uniref:hypothetical protein n=1 Tax=Cardinium endosymbiont of Dermatophagoides farinae TaxID=2597823 RepID=UPI0011822748|nr:hypothetical protein [Cardinium endosymbiont of Dermatophagoides farinae]TSJ81106.1 hypothetical protein FPG78_03775 [Cardinium endosymbiont of Dermatophagoides farinae]UWW97148.1 MAG: hypothetical protein NMK33_01090 [Candidatus Cardinium sp.]